MRLDDADARITGEASHWKSKPDADPPPLPAACRAVCRHRAVPRRDKLSVAIFSQSGYRVYRETREGDPVQ